MRPYKMQPIPRRNILHGDIPPLPRKLLTYVHYVREQHQGLLNKWLYSEKRGSVKVSGSKYAHLQKLNKYRQRALGYKV
jgi:hypothetical protein